MHQTVARWVRTTAMAGGCFALLGGGCLPENFWVDKGGEILNRSIIGVINAVLAAAGTGITI